MHTIKLEGLLIPEMNDLNRQTAMNLHALTRTLRRPESVQAGSEIDLELSEIEERLERLMGEFRCRSP